MHGGCLGCVHSLINLASPAWPTLPRAVRTHAGRNSEGYSECPYLTGELAHAVVTGMQGDDERYVQVVAGCKHFVPYDGPSTNHASDYDLFSTYLPAFKRCMEAKGPAWQGALNVMCSYGPVAGVRGYAGTESCTNDRILQTILKGRYNFSGFVISDLGAVDASKPDSLQAGMDVYLGTGAGAGDVQAWLQKGSLDQTRLDDAVRRTMLPRFLEGEFDPPEMVPYWDTAAFGCDQIGHARNRRLGYEAAVQSLVLLRNDGTLPLSPQAGKAVALIGPFADHARWMFQRYSHVPAPTSPLLVSVAQAMRAAAGPGVEITTTPGCTDANTTTKCASLDTGAVAAAEAAADVLVLCVGTGEPVESETAHDGIGATISLPGMQEQLVASALASGKKVVVVLFTTSPKNGPYMTHANAVLQAYYPQTSGGAAIADVLLGSAVPSGRMATTWPSQWNCTTQGCTTLPARLLGSKVTYSGPPKRQTWPPNEPVPSVAFASPPTTPHPHAGAPWARRGKQTRPV